SVRRTVGCGGHVPRPLERLALQAELLPPPLDELPAHRRLRLSQEEGARAELVVEGSHRAVEGGARPVGREPPPTARAPTPALLRTRGLRRRVRVVCGGRAAGARAGIRQAHGRVWRTRPAPDRAPDG